MKKIMLFVLFLFSLPPPGGGTGINISHPNSPLRKAIIVIEKRVIEQELARTGQFEYEIIDNTIPEYTVTGTPLPSWAKFTLIIRNATTGETASFRKGTKIWFEILQSVAGGGEDDWEEILNSNWIVGYDEQSPYVFSEEGMFVGFQGEKIIKEVGTRISDDSRLCLMIHVLP